MSLLGRARGPPGRGVLSSGGQGVYSQLLLGGPVSACGWDGSAPQRAHPSGVGSRAGSGSDTGGGSTAVVSAGVDAGALVAAAGARAAWLLRQAVGVHVRPWWRREAERLD